MTDDTLSETATLVLGSTFGWGAILTFHMQESVPSPEMQAALDELVQAGKMVREMGLDDMPAHGQAVRYRVAPDIDLDAYRRIAAKRFFDGDVPSIRVYIPKEPRT
jgi:hypothetical protein